MSQNDCKHQSCLSIQVPGTNNESCAGLKIYSSICNCKFFLWNIGLNGRSVFLKLNIIQRIIVDYLINLLKCRTVFKWMAMRSCMEFTTFRNALKGKHLSSPNEEIHVFRLSVVSVNYDVDFISSFSSCSLNLVDKVSISIIKSLYLSFYVLIVLSICSHLLR